MFRRSNATRHQAVERWAAPDRPSRHTPAGTLVGAQAALVEPELCPDPDSPRVAVAPAVTPCGTAQAQTVKEWLNIHAEMAHSPVVLGAYQGIQESIIRHGTFDGPTREAIALAVGAVDECGYRQSAHTMGGKAAGLDEDRMLAIRAGRPTGDDKLDTLLAVIREAARDVGNVNDGTWKRAQAAG